jgi:hypothetical protein
MRISRGAIDRPIHKDGRPCPIRRSPRLSSEHSAPGSGKCAQPELDRQSDQVTGVLDSDSHHHLRHWLSLRDLIAYSFQKPRETFMVPIPMRLARCSFCRLLPFSCSLLANIILPLGRTNLFSSRTMIECPQRSGKQSRHWQLWIGTSPLHSSLTGLRTMARIH